METKLCRICGKLGQNFVHIFKTEGLRSKIETCLPIIVSPYCLLPDAICGECTATVDSFYTFIKNCLQNIIILEAQYDIQESCLKSKQKRDKGSMVDLSHRKANKGVQTDDYLDVLSGRSTDLKEFCLNFPQTLTFLNSEATFPKKYSALVEYDIDTDSSLDENICNGKVELSNELQSFNKITKFVDSITSKDLLPTKIHCCNDLEKDLISEISERRNLKRKNDVIEVYKPRIFKPEITNKRKNKIPKKIDTQEISEETVSFQKPDEAEILQRNEICDTQIQTATPFQHEILPASMLPQTCLLCDTQFASPAAVASHVFEAHGIDMVSEIVSLGSGDSLPEKSKKKIPNLVKISDLKRNDSNDETLERMNEDPPTLQPSFVCPNCPGIFTRKQDLMTHLRLKHPELAAYLCGICLQQCTSYINLTSHLQVCSQQHQIKTRYICQVCQYGDDNLKWLENHILVHDFLFDTCRKQLKIFDPEDYIEVNDNSENRSSTPATKGLNCAECGLSEFQSFKEFSSHRRNQHSIFHCDLCNKFYGRNSHLWKHVNRLHKNHPSITCQLCYKTSASKYHLLQHFNKTHMNKGPRSDKEDFMSQKFSAFDFQSVKQSFMKQDLIETEERKDELSEQDGDSNDLQQWDQEEEELVMMEEPASAPKEIDSSHNLYTNIITNYTPPLNEGDYKCPKCSKAFQKKLLLKKHKKNCRPRNQKDLLTRCKTCSRTFKDRQSLTKHLVNYHSEYICEICNGKMQSKCEIVSHIRFRHPCCHLFCKICRNVLRSKADMQEHLHNHVESYICQFCGDPLPSKIKLKMHILSLHRKMLSLSCGICLKLFETQHILRDHVRLVHKNQLAPLTSCPVCGKNYGSKWKTFDHLNKSHGRIFKACKTCLGVFETDAQLQAHCDLTSHGGPGVTTPANASKTSITSQMSSATSDMAAKNDESDSEEDEQTDSECDMEQDLEQKFLPQDTKMMLLEKRISGEKVNEDEAQKLQTTDKKVPLLVGKKLPLKREDDPDRSNSSKRTVYVNSNDPSYCEICLKTWPAKKHLWQHYIRCHKSVAATVCGICLQTNDTYESLQKHLRETHPTLLHGQGYGSNFICRICGRYHNASSKLRLHMVIHENFDWRTLDDPNKPTRMDSDENPTSNGFKDAKEEPHGDINYDSLIEQVECSSQSENEDFDREMPQGEARQADSSSEEEDSDGSAISEVQVAIEEKPALTNPLEYTISSDDSSSSFSSKTHSSDEERSFSSQSKSNSNTADSLSNSNVFCRKPEELDSAVQSISYECMEPEDLNVEDNYCDMQNPCLNDNEIESAVGSIL
ncbi:unnamed protein product [Phaedon cochleariae]|uniref:Uncharacterized protein n=1 Tax=Phaedon cochleariae TaxID=80249 RepID=A0A9P0DDU0_PHACE|nr:unnamed protein product [Phaedon cochleariae]